MVVEFRRLEQKTQLSDCEIRNAMNYNENSLGITAALPDTTPKWQNNNNVRRKKATTTTTTVMRKKQCSNDAFIAELKSNLYSQFGSVWYQIEQDVQLHLTSHKPATYIPCFTRLRMPCKLGSTNATTKNIIKYNKFTGHIRNETKLKATKNIKKGEEKKNASDCMAKIMRRY